MSFLVSQPPITRQKKALALTAALLADTLQLASIPEYLFGGYIADNIIDVLVAFVLLAIVGFRWQFLLAFVIELTPGLDLFPTWTAVILALPVEHPGPVTVQTVAKEPPLLLDQPHRTGPNAPDIIDAEVTNPKE